MNTVTTDSISPTPEPTPNRDLALGLVAWFTISLVIAAAGALTRLPPPAIAITIAAVVGAFVWRYRSSTDFRARIDRIDLRVPIAYHVVRVLFGAWFLYDHARGLLPGSFALSAGRGDIAVGLLAPLAAVLATRTESRTARRAVIAWNVLGLFDIVAVVLNAQRLLVLEHDASMHAAFVRLPYPLLPLFVVPLVIATHLLVFARLRSARDGGPARRDA